ncbi:MAG: polysaccharide deacetylase family protein [Deltaproteobacteria bacterium]|nr:polysaccharide deacetylase family protein [Deltaproteobacteria bacterium]
MRWPQALVAAMLAWVAADLLVGRLPGWPEAAGLAVMFGGLALAAMRLSAQGFVKAFCRAAGARARIALTFDDGPDPATTPQVLDVLRRHGVRATFFVLGAKVDAHPQLVARLREQGHEVGTHGYDHDWRSVLTVAGARRQVQRGVDSLLRALGVPPVFFRPPYGVVTPALAVALAGARLQVVGWSLRTRDGTGRGEPLARAQWVVRVARAGDVILMHDAPREPGGRMPLGPAMLESVIVGLKDRGFELVVLSDLLARAAA